MADEEIPDKTAPDDLDPAFDSIDATMKSGPTREVSVTPEALAQIVNEAVANAITAYQQSLAESAEPAPGGGASRDPSKPAAEPQTPWRAKLEQLQGDMGIGDIEFDRPRAEPAETIVQRQLSAQMGVHDFDFDEIPAASGEPAVSTRTEADAVAGWKTPPHDAVPAASADVEQTRATAEGEHVRPRAAAPAVKPMGGEAAAPQPSADDAGQEFKWIEEALDAGRVRTEADVLPAPSAVDPPPDRTPEPVASTIAQGAVTPEPKSRETVTTPQVRETLSKPAVRQTLKKPEASSKPEVRETRRSLSSWFRAAPADTPQAQVPEPAAAMPGRERKLPAATVMPPAVPPVLPVPPAALPAAPPVTVPPAAAARPESPPKAATPDQNAAARPVTPEDAAKTTFFTFDPILPVPPRLPRESIEPPKKG